MPSVAVVTTFAKDHINLYGKKFVESFNVNCKYPLYIYAEDFTAEDFVEDYYNYADGKLDFK